MLNALHTFSYSILSINKWAVGIPINFILEMKKIFRMYQRIAQEPISDECYSQELTRLVTSGSVQKLSHVQFFVTPLTVAHQASLSITNSQSLLKLMSIESVTPSSHSQPLSSPSPPTFNLSQHQGLFQWISSSHQVAKVLAFQASASVLPMNIQDWFPLWLTGLISLQ